MIIDFTFNNKLIKAYFDGDNSYIPSNELIYLHQHPLIRQSFLVEIEKRINEAAVVLAKKNMQGVVVQRFIESTNALGAELPNITQQNAPKILDELRKVYKLCNGLLN